MFFDFLNWHISCSGKLLARTLQKKQERYQTVGIDASERSDILQSAKCVP